MVDRLARLQVATAALSHALTPEQVASVIVEEALTALEAAAGSLFLIGQDGDLELICSRGYDQSILSGFARLPHDSQLPLAIAARTGEPIWLQAGDVLRQYAELANVNLTMGSPSMAAVPILVQRRPIGVVGLSFAQACSFHPDERAFILTLVGLSALAIERARLLCAEREARLAAEAAQARLQAAFRAAPLPIMVSGVDGNIELWNPACERVLGWTAAESLGKPNPLIPLDGPKNRHALFDASLAGGSIIGAEIQRRDKSGTPLDLLVSVAPFTDPVGVVTGVVALGIDISEQKQAEARLRASEERFHAIFEHAPVGINVTDASGRYCQTNAAFQRMLGYTGDELATRTFRDVTHHEDVTPDTCRYDDMLAGNVTSYVLEKRYVRKDGEFVWVRISVSNLHRSDGQCLVAGDESRGFGIAVVEDITESKRAEHALAASEQRYRGVVEASLDGILMTDLHGTITFANRQMAELLALSSPDDLVGRQTLDFLARDDRASALAEMRKIVTRGSAANVRFALTRANGTAFPCEMSASVVSGADGQPAAVTAVIRDMTEQQAYEEQLRRQALHDALTDLPNRTLFNDRLHQALLSARRSENPCTLLLADLDRFKDVNDTLGHGVGDELLQQVGLRLRAVLREADTVARLGGDEFAILLPGTDEAGAVRVVDTLLDTFGEPFMVDGQTFYQGLSIGIALFPEHGEDVATLLRRADVAMYAAKRTGGAHYSVYQAASDPHSERRLALMAGLREAIDQGQLTLYFQPKVSLRTGHAEQVEALVRWIHPRFGFIPPDQFIALAEHTGLIKPMANWVLNEALRQMSCWRAAGHQVSIAVNLSAHNLQDRGMVSSIASLLGRWKVPARALGIEITESALMANPDHAMETLTALHDMGVSIAIDDFGTGYSSLAYLQRLPANEVKIDRTFVAGMCTPSSGSSSIVRSVVDLGHTLDLQVVAEGVESQQALDILGIMGCDIVQGYYLGRPMPASEYIAWLASWRQRSCFLPDMAV